MIRDVCQVVWALDWQIRTITYSRIRWCRYSVIKYFQQLQLAESAERAGQKTMEEQNNRFCSIVFDIPSTTYPKRTDSFQFIYIIDNGYEWLFIAKSRPGQQLRSWNIYATDLSWSNSYFIFVTCILGNWNNQIILLCNYLKFIDFYLKPPGAYTTRLLHGKLTIFL